MDRPQNLDLELVACVIEHGQRMLGKPPTLLKNLCDELLTRGLPLARVHVTFIPRHPQLRVGLLKWIPNRPGSWGHISWPDTRVRSPVFRRNPLYLLREGHLEEVRTRLTDTSRVERFRLTRELAKDGMTDYFALAIDSGLQSPNTIAFATDRVDGFTDDDVDRLRSVAWALQVNMQRDTWYTLSETICRTYIGTRAGQKVLNGEIRRGQYSRINAVVWFCDMRGFSELSRLHSDDTVFDTLHTFFDAVGSAIESNGGEILKFIGDSVLAIFPYGAEDEAQIACQAAFEGALACLESLDKVNYKRLAVGDQNLRCGIGLHRGEVLYGNVGTETRLDFTVMGQTVNLANRLESLCAKLGEHLLVTDAVADKLDQKVTPRGCHYVKGFTESISVHGLPADKVFAASKAPAAITPPLFEFQKDG
jgi:adenylate cyclase